MNILLAVDSTDPAQHAISETIAGPWPEGSKLAVATVVPSRGSRQEVAISFVEHLAQIVKSKNESFSTVYGITLLGSPRTELIKLAEKEKSDLLIVGARHYGSTRIFGNLIRRLCQGVGSSLRISRKTDIADLYRVLLIQRWWSR